MKFFYLAKNEKPFSTQWFTNGKDLIVCGHKNSDVDNDHCVFCFIKHSQNENEQCFCNSFFSKLKYVWWKYFGFLLLRETYTKSFAIAILVFFVFFPSCHFFWTDCQKLLSQRFQISYQERLWPRSGHSLYILKKSFVKIGVHTKKIFRKNCCSWRVWHMTQLLHDNRHSQHAKKHKKQPETWKQVN